MSRADLKPGLYRLTKSFVNPHLEKVTHRDLMGVIRVFPEGWDWLVHTEGRADLARPPLMVMAAGGNWCQSMYVHKADHLQAEADWDEEHDDIPPLFAPPEFLEALVPQEPDTFTRIQQIHKHTRPRIDFEDVVALLMETGKVTTEDVLDAVTTATKQNGEGWERVLEKRDDDQDLYSAAVNEVFNETGFHYID